MPPRGGNPALTDEQLEDVVTYIRYQTAKANGGLSAAPAAPAAPTAVPPTTSASATEDSGALPIDSILHPATEATAAATEDDFQLPINSFLTPSGEEATTPDGKTPLTDKEQKWLEKLTPEQRLDFVNKHNAAAIEAAKKRKKETA